METKDFLRLLLPEQDNYILFIASPERKPYNLNFASLDECCKQAAAIDEGVATVYFAVGKHKDNEEVLASGFKKTLRKQRTATCFKTLCVDIDVGGSHAHQTARDGAKALLAACATLSLPQPMLVSSGMGVHAYWPLDTVINTDMWVNLSTALQTALQSCGVDLDPSKVKDPSMVLRPAGTHHKKDVRSWKEVRVISPQTALPVLHLAQVLAKFRSKDPVRPAGKPQRKSAIMDAVLSGGEAPVKLDDLRTCAQLAAVLDSGGVTNAAGGAVEEPLWRATLGIAKYCEDPGDAVVSLAGGHPDFDYTISYEKMEAYQGTGPTLCQSFDNLCPGVCGKCPYQGRIKTPAALSRGSEVVQAQVAVDSVDPAMAGVVAPVQSVTVPGYSFKANKLVYRPPAGDEDVLIAEYNLFIMGTVNTTDEDQMMVKIAVEMPPVVGDTILQANRWRAIDVPLTAITSGGRDLLNALAQKQIFIRQDIERIKRYLMSYLAELQKQRRMQYFHKCFGWQADGSFVAPTGIIGGDHDGDTPNYEGAVSSYVDFMQPHGDLGTWSKATAMFNVPGLEHHATVFLMMAGSVLLEFTGINSVLVNMYSSDSGSGKTTVGMFGSSVWGDPTRLQRIVTDTDKSLYKHFGLLHSLGAYIDEITTMDDDRFRSFAYSIPEGREPERLLSSADGFRHGESWRMPVFASSNADAYDLLSSRLTSEAEKYRVLQFPLNRTDFFQTAENGYTIHRVVTQNYGLAGPVIMREIMDMGGAANLVERGMQEFEAEFDFQFDGPERFYKPVFVSAWIIGKIMRKLGLIQFDPAAKIKHSLPVVHEIRRSAVADKMDGIDTIGQFMTEHGHAVVLLRVFPDSSGNVRCDIVPPPHRAAVARSEVERERGGRFLSGMTYINSMIFKKWCRNNGAEYKSVIRDLKSLGVGVREGVRRSLYKGAEGHGAAGQTTCIALDVGTHPRLIESHELLTTASVGGTPRMVSVSDG